MRALRAWHQLRGAYSAEKLRWRKDQLTRNPLAMNSSQLSAGLQRCGRRHHNLNPSSFVRFLSRRIECYGQFDFLLTSFDNYWHFVAGLIFAESAIEVF